MYDTYTAFTIGFQFNGSPIKNFVNVYSYSVPGSIKFHNFWLKVHRKMFKYKRISKSTLKFTYLLSGTTFYVSICPIKYRKSIILSDDNRILISRDLLYVISRPSYYMISQRFCD